MVEGFYLRLYRVFDGCFESIQNLENNAVQLSKRVSRRKVLSIKCQVLSLKPNTQHPMPNTPNNFYSGGHGEEETPVPIPNTAVKLFSGGCSWSEGSREINTLPG